MRILLLPFSALFFAGVWLRNFFYDRGLFKSHRLPVKVVSVGNISLGGTGKTPMAELLLEYFSKKGLRVAYLSRGYGRLSKGYKKVDPQAKDSRDFGDEAFQIANKFPLLPVSVCENRVHGVEELIKSEHIDLVVLDDAFQHRRIARDLDIVMVDAGRLPQQDFLLPAGRLREPLGSLRRAHHIVINKVREEKEVDQISARFRRHRHSFARPEFTEILPFFPNQGALQIDDLKGREAIAFSGLGNNDYFKDQLESLGIRLLAFYPFPDHHDYTGADLGKILENYSAGNKKSGKFGGPLILTSEKDRYRLSALSFPESYQQYPFYYVQISLSWMAGWEGLEEQLKEIADP